MVSVIPILVLLLLSLCHSVYNVRSGPKTFRRRFCKKLPHLTFNGGDDPIRIAREKDQVVVISLVTARNHGHLRYQLKCLNVLSLYYQFVESQRVQVIALNDPRTRHLYTPMQQGRSRVMFLNDMDQPHMFRRLGNVWDALIIDPCGRIAFHYFYPKNSLRFRFVSDAIHSTLHYGQRICGACHRKKPGHLAKQIATRPPAVQNVTSTPSPVKIIVNKNKPIKVEGESGIHHMDEDNKWSNPLEIKRQRQILVPNKDRWGYPVAEIVDDRTVQHTEQPATEEPRFQPLSKARQSEGVNKVRINTTKLPSKSSWKNVQTKTFQEVRITTPASPKISVPKATSRIKSSLEDNQKEDIEKLVEEVRITTTDAPKTPSLRNMDHQNVEKAKTPDEETSETGIAEKNTDTSVNLKDDSPSIRNDIPSVLHYNTSRDKTDVSSVLEMNKSTVGLKKPKNRTSTLVGDISTQSTDVSVLVEDDASRKHKKKSPDPILAKMTNSIEDIWKESTNSIKKTTTRKQSRKRINRKQNLKKSTNKKQALRSFVSIYPKRNIINEGEETTTAFNINEGKIPSPFRKIDENNRSLRKKNYHGTKDISMDSDDRSYDSMSFKSGRLGSVRSQDTSNDQQEDWVNKLVHDYILASQLGNEF